MNDVQIIHIVDDDDAVRQSLSFMLSSAGFPVQLYESAVVFLDSMHPAINGCVITDVRMPDLSGIELLRRLHDQVPHLPVVVMTGHGDVPLAVEAMKAGAVDFIEKPFDEDDLLKAVKAALAKGENEGSGEVPEIIARVATLSERERQVLEGLVAGQANKVIAAAHGISPRTVEVYRANVMTKMQVKSLPELVRLAVLAKVVPSAAG